MRYMSKKNVAISLMCLFLVVAFAVAENGVGPYNRAADVNKDGLVDILDLVEVGQAYGSNYTLMTQPNKTTVTVLSFDKEPPEVENATVAIIDPEVFFGAVAVQYTNSSGIATFELSSNKNYTGIAWSGSAYNYANFTTNSSGEASVLILLGEPSLPPIRALPQGWIVVTLLDNETGSVMFLREFYIGIHRIEFNPSNYSFVSEYTYRGVCSHVGIIVIPPNWQFNEPSSEWGLVHEDSVYGYIGCYGVYSPDEDGCANVILYVTLP